MNDPLLVRCSQRVDDRQHDRGETRGFEWTSLLQRLLETLAAQQLHDEERIASTRLSKVEHANDRRVVQLGRGASLCEQLRRAHVRLRARRAVEQLERDHSVECATLRHPHLSEATLAEHADQLVSVRDDRSRFVRLGRRRLRRRREAHLRGKARAWRRTSHRGDRCSERSRGRSRRLGGCGNYASRRRTYDRRRCDDGRRFDDNRRCGRRCRCRLRRRRSFVTPRRIDLPGSDRRRQVLVLQDGRGRDAMLRGLLGGRSDLCERRQCLAELVQARIAERQLRAQTSHDDALELRRNVASNGAQGLGIRGLCDRGAEAGRE